MIFTYTENKTFKMLECLPQILRKAKLFKNALDLKIPYHFNGKVFMNIAQNISTTCLNAYF